MPSFRSRFLGFILSCAVAGAAALVPVPGPKGPFPLMGLEPNRGQAKPEILFLARGYSSLAVTGQSVLYSPLGVRLSLAAGNPNPAVRFSDPLPGAVNSFTGAETRKWVTGIPRYAAAHLAEVYPGVDVQYVMAADGQLALKLLFRSGVDPKAVVFEVPKAVATARSSDGSLYVRLGPNVRFDPALVYPPPVAFQEAASGRVSRNVTFEVRSTTRFGFQVEERDSALPLQIEMKLGAPGTVPYARTRYTVDNAGNMFVAATVPDAAGKDAPFPADRWEGCGANIGFPIACSDVAIYKFSRSGDLVFVSYLEGRTREQASFLRLAPDGGLIVTGSTDSADFPVTAAALQPGYAGPASAPGYSSSSQVEGDFFAVRLDPAGGTLRASTYFGGPDADSAGETALGVDGSVFFLPKWLGKFRARMPASRGALQADCAGDPCTNGYAARLSPSLDRLLYGTYLPGIVMATAKLHSDGSVYYAGSAGPGFPATPGAYQPRVAGNYDGIVARLDPSGATLLFATYIGGADTDWILRMAVAPNGSVWAAVSSFVQCCVNIKYRLVRLNAKGERLLADKPIDVGDLAVDRDGNLHATAAGQFTVGPDAFQAHACAWSYLAYLKLNPSGEQLFATYLPAGAGSDFDGTSARGLPVLPIGDERFEIVEGQSMGAFAGCVVDAASFGNPDTVSPGGIVTLFGSRMGPREGIGFRLEDGRVPTTLGGTRVLVNGEPVPILFASYWQLNVILPYSLPVGTWTKIQVETNGIRWNELGSSRVQRAGISLFRLDDSPNRPAAALNEDGTLNSPRNPAKKGSRVMLFGTGGGPTVPPSVAGEVTPLEPRPLEYGALVQILGGAMLPVEYAGAAPSLVTGVTQINVKLPETIPDVPDFPRGLLPLSVVTPGLSFYPGHVTVAIEVN